MSDKSISDSSEAPAPDPTATPQQGSLPVWMLIFFVLMVFQALVSVSYAVTMNGFAADSGYFLAYGSLCSTVPVVAEIDRFGPFLIAGLWLVCLYLGISRSQRFYRFALTTALVSIAYGATTTVIGPFSFRVGPSEFDPATLNCGRWPRDITQLPDLAILQMDWLGLPITIFGLSMVIVSLAVYVYLRTSRRARAIYRRAD